MFGLLRHTHIQMGCWSSAISVLSTLAFSSAHATVLEYDTAGEVTVTESQTKSTKTANIEHTAAEPAKSSKLRELTRDVAVRYSGAVGVRHAGLDALTFIEIFEFLIERESAFNPEALSEKGAKGLGQLMPKTAQDMGVKNAFDPHQNLIGSAKYFTLMLKQFGNLEHALAAYNAGPERVKQYSGIPPFKETQAYVNWILDKAGIKKSNATVQKASAPKNPNTQTEDPLKGDVSVWEF